MVEQRITIKAITLFRESNGLFDYDASNYHRCKIKLNEDSIIVRQGENVHSVHHSSLNNLQNNPTILALFYKKNRNFMLSSSINKTEGKNWEKPWIVINSLKTTEYLLSEGDVFRLGKIKFTIKEISGYKQSEVHRSVLHSKTLQNGGLGGLVKSKTDLSVPIHLETQIISNSCRICLLDDNDDLNPLISPCFCTGTMGVIHIGCLQRWLDSKITQNSHRDVKIYTWRSLNCELCKFKYPNKILVDNKTIDLVIIEKPPTTNYMILESCNNKKKCIHVLNLDDKKVIRLGRGYDSDMRIPDISISRNHACINIRSSGLYIQDLNSKFGTLIRMKKDICLDLDNKFKIQTGRSLLKISTSKPWSFFGCLFGCGKIKDSDDENQRFRNATSDSSSNNL
ncbi:hypothetical protein SteCoe_30187 [Stentor coeruleus]|uniref:FHA domain-containing protein n=1 Tax=Stentor coeruleus TaxID=5963 RepID=A0A1R2B454_9CILI|nr:hypothetical protein SteCoe_30187 [Stentor coeruleus]